MEKNYINTEFNALYVITNNLQRYISDVMDEHPRIAPKDLINKIKESSIMHLNAEMFMNIVMHNGALPIAKWMKENIGEREAFSWCLDAGELINLLRLL